MTDQPRAAAPASGSAPGGSASGDAADGRPAERVVIRDKRKIDPTGGAGQPAATGGKETAAGQPADGEPKPAAKAGPAGDDGTRAAEESVVEDTASGEVSASEEPAPGDDAERPAAEGEVLVGEVEETVEEATAPVVDAPTPAAGAKPLGAELEALRAELDERTRDVQRVSAEYANYRKRVDRDRGVAAEQTTGTVLTELLPVLDDLDRARDHGDLVGPFGSVAEKLTAALGKFGLTGFGEKGDPFDPTRHEAVAHLTSAEVTEPTCVEVMRRGYLLGERLLRPALVAVADPE
ncbi:MULTISPECIES: nucleotide exchange factor GrpE [Polymorphospora]|uniref:Protein GrpE n=1 Tax=Polymorphospora lycopeni TaxID=3140240 RepID=A0ABV5CI47_9ACTN